MYRIWKKGRRHCREECGVRNIELVIQLLLCRWFEVPKGAEKNEDYNCELENVRQMTFQILKTITSDFFNTLNSLN